MKKLLLILLCVPLLFSCGEKEKDGINTSCDCLEDLLTNYTSIYNLIQKYDNANELLENEKDVVSSLDYFRNIQDINSICEKIFQKDKGSRSEMIMRCKIEIDDFKFFLKIQDYILHSTDDNKHFQEYVNKETGFEFPINRNRIFNIKRK